MSDARDIILDALVILVDDLKSASDSGDTDKADDIVATLAAIGDALQANK